jgi:squalene-hopene/tetraprenyl-beta-curcumene cyclase
MIRISFVFVLLAASAASGADIPKVPSPDPNEPMAKVYSPEKAAASLDGFGVEWTRERKCATCHTNIPYLMARPLLKGDAAGWKEVRTFLENQVTNWATEKPKGDAYVVITAVGLAFNDGQTTGKLSAPAKAALDKMWSMQRKTGEWNWIKCGWPPLEHDDYYGAVLAAVGVGSAPEQYARSDAAMPGVAKLSEYLTKTPPPDLHHKAVLLWASTKIDGLMTAAARKAAVTELRAKQRADGGWALPSLGKYMRKDKSENDPDAPSDAYATGLVVYVLRQAGIPADDPAIAKGVIWLKANQRESGQWFTRSLNNDEHHYIAHTGTAYAVLALDACKGAKVAGK